MRLDTLKTLRNRLFARTAAEAALPPALVALGAAAAVVVWDAVWAAPPWARFAGLAVAAAAGLATVALAASALRRRDWSDLGLARYAAARDAGAPNALVSYLETEGRGPVAPYVASRLAEAAAREAAAIDPRRLVALGESSRNAALAAALAAAAALPVALGYDPARLVRFPEPAPPGAGEAGASPAGAADAADALAVTIVPPPYTGRPAERLERPTEIVALAGSRVEVELRPGRPGSGATLSVNGAEPEPMRPSGDLLAASFVARDAGSVAVRPADPAGDRPPLLLPLEIAADRAPEVRITSPAGDILVEPAVRPRALTVEFEASDDLGLGPMRLRYIRSTGEGDAAEFVNGQLPVSVAARSGAKVTGRCTIDLDRAGVGPGSALVFHVEADDRNAVSGPSTGLSESLVFEVASPRQPAAIALDELRPEDMQRFLASQRMILDRTLKLHAERERIPRDELVARSTDLARQQREFKESFDQFIEIHGANEIAHAHAAGPDEHEGEEHAAEQGEAGEETVERAEEAHERAVEARTGAHDHGESAPASSAAGPFRDLLEAVRAMWDAERSLGVAETAEAIPSERRALEYLQRARKAVRYFPRVTVKTKPIDLKRRYAAELDDLTSRVERLAARELSPHERALRDALASLLAAMRSAAAISPGPRDAAERATRLGEELAATGARLLEVESGYDPALVAVAARVSAASADARRYAGALASGDERRAVSARTVLGDDLLGAAAQLAALLDSRPGVRGGGRVAPASAGERRRAGDYFRRLARPSP